MWSRLYAAVVSFGRYALLGGIFLSFTPRVMSSQYGGGCQVQWRVPSTVEGYLAVQWGAIMKYSGGCGVRWRAI